MPRHIDENVTARYAAEAAAKESALQKVRDAIASTRTRLTGKVADPSALQPVYGQVEKDGRGAGRMVEDQTQLKGFKVDKPGDMYDSYDANGNFLGTFKYKSGGFLQGLSDNITSIAHSPLGQVGITLAGSALGVPAPITAGLLGAQDGDIMQGVRNAALAYAGQELFKGDPTATGSGAVPANPMAIDPATAAQTGGTAGGLLPAAPAGLPTIPFVDTPTVPDIPAANPMGIDPATAQQVGGTPGGNIPAATPPSIPVGAGLPANPMGIDPATAQQTGGTPGGTIPAAPPGTPVPPPIPPGGGGPAPQTPDTPGPKPDTPATPPGTTPPGVPPGLDLSKLTWADLVKLLGVTGAIAALTGGTGGSSGGGYYQRTPEQEERFTRKATKWDWDKINAEAAAKGLTPNQFIARNWNRMQPGGAYDQPVQAAAPAATPAGGATPATPAPAGPTPVAQPEDKTTPRMVVPRARGGLMSDSVPAYVGGLNQIYGLAKGGGTGRSDDINARLSDGEYVMDAETVAMLGDGSTQAGAARLDAMRQQLRKHKGAALSKGQFSPDAKSPLAYLKGVM